MKKKFRYSRNPQIKIQYEEAKREANYIVRKAKYEYERSIAINMKEDSKIFWKFFQSKTKTKESIPSIVDKDGTLYSDDKIKAEIMNNRFFQCLYYRR